MTTVPFYQINAFTQDLFKGNIAGVCILPEQAAALLQSVATETNYPATAFITRRGDDFNLSWFSPKTQLPLCGHGTLAAAHALKDQGWLRPETPVRFHTKGGILTARLLPGDWIEMEFPAFTLEPVPLPERLVDAFPTARREALLAGGRYLVELESEAAVVNFQPDFEKLKDYLVIITAAARQESPYDFVSRFFAASLGAYEDAVTGSAHCALVPFWSKRLRQQSMKAYQASARGGMLRVRLEGENVFIAGQAMTVIKGEMQIP